MFKKRLLLAVACSTTIFQGCSSAPQAPKLTPEQAAAERVASFHIYDDLEVGFKESDSVVNWSWFYKAGYVLALDVSGRLYNARDIRSISSYGDSYGKTVKVAFVGVSEPKRVPLADLQWRLCKKDKTCDFWTDLDKQVRSSKQWNSHLYSVDLLEGLSSISEEQIQRLSHGYYRSLYNLPPDQKGASAPGLWGASGKATIEVLIDDDLRRLEARRNGALNQWDASQAVQKQQAEAIAAQDAKMLASAASGATMACSFNGMVSRMSSMDAVQEGRVKCSGLTEEQHLDRLKQMGWVVVSWDKSSDVVPSSPMLHYRWSYVLQKK